MKQSGHLNPSEETGTGCPAIQSMEGHLQTSMEVWFNNNDIEFYISRGLVCVKVERTKQMREETHLLFGYIPARSHLKSRKCFMTSVQSMIHFPPKVVICNVCHNGSGRLLCKFVETHASNNIDPLYRFWQAGLADRLDV